MKRLLLFTLLIAALCGPSPAPAQRTVDPEVLLARQATADQALFFALARGDIPAMVTLRAEGANPNTSLSMLGLKVKDVFGDEEPIMNQPFDPTGWPILHWAVYKGDLEAVKMLIRAGARVNTPDIYGATALHWAAWGGRHSIAKLILNNGASCRATDIKKRTAKDWAIMMGQNDLIRLLAGRTCRPAPIGDSDLDGVPDDQDLCPNTPYGAPVDDRGCWVVAYATFFDFDKSVVKAKYLPYLADTAAVLKNYPDLAVEVQGHTDWVGPGEYNLKLGQRRAEAVKKVLVNNGVRAERLLTSSLGESQPIADNRSSGGRARNRRVEIHVNQPGGPYAASPAAGGPPPPETVETYNGVPVVR
ncbi:MAG: ankyrin repeat domain-containing protein [Candidatus Adiutrix sp.]|nr:ankyrin repeat domain-containing protein [Candidatus Adiutrix sp.]